MSTNKDEILSNFIAITQCSNDEATRYLEAANWNAETAMEIFFDNGGSDADLPPTAVNTIPPPAANVNPSPSGNISSGGTGGYESDDEGTMQSAIEESLRATAAASSKDDQKKDKKPAPSSRFGTIGGLQNDEENSDEEEGQAFYAGGSERSGQQIIGPPKPKTDAKKIEKIFEAARAQGAVEAGEDDDDDEHASSGRKKKEKTFGGVGYTLGDETTPSRTLGQPAAQAAATANRPEQLPLRFYSDGFTVGDGELRKFEDNKEFMEHIKRGEVPPELRNLSSGGRQVEVRLEDHRGEDYKRMAPAFKPFGGHGNVLGSPAPNVIAATTTGPIPTKSSMVPSTTTAPVPSDANRLEQLAEQRLKSSGSSSTTLRLRLPEISTPLRFQIDLNRTLAEVRKFLSENVPSLQSNAFEFIEPPSTKIDRANESKTIAENKLTNAVIAIRKIT